MIHNETGMCSPAVGENEIIEIMDGKDDSQAAMADAAWAKGYIATIYPGVVLNEEQQSMFDDLEKILEGGNAQIL